MSEWYGKEVDPNIETGPKKGENKIISIESGRKVEEPGNERNLKKKNGVDSGFHLELKLGNGKLFIVDTWALFYAFKKVNVKPGDTIKILHPGHGEYIIETDTTREKEWDDMEEESA